jgi:hypothetical protein
LDFGFSTHYRLREFLDGTETINTLWNFVKAFQRCRTSYLAQAMATDVELYEQNLNRPTRQAESAPELVEMDLSASLLMGMHELLQQLVHWTAANVPKGAKKPRVKRLPRPQTATQLYTRRKAREAHERLETEIVYVPQAQFDRIVAGVSSELVEG